MDDKTRKILARPFDQALVKQRTGPGGQTLTYVSVQAYIDRLNEAFEGDWSFETTHREQHEDQLLVEGRVSAAGVIKTGLGGATVMRRRDDNRIVDIANDFKRAEADSLKRCCRLLGIGCHLYADIEDDAGEPATPPPRQVSGPPRSAEPSSEASRPALTSRITAKQVSLLWILAQQLGVERSAFRTRVRDRFGAMPEYLTKSTATELISDMKAALEKRQANGRDTHGGAERIPGVEG